MYCLYIPYAIVTTGIMVCCRLIFFLTLVFTLVTLKQVYDAELSVGYGDEAEDAMARFGNQALE